MKRRGERSFCAAVALMAAAAALISSGVRGSRGCATAPGKQMHVDSLHGRYRRYKGW